MKKTLFYCGSLLLGTSLVSAAPLFSDNFDSYTEDPLVGQGPWIITGSATNNPISISDGKVVLGIAGGQDANAGFAATSNTEGTSFYIGMTINVTSATAAGDYFAHVTPNAGNSSSFFSRVFIRSSGVGFQLGLVDTSGAGSTITYGSEVLDFGSDYRVVVGQNFLSGSNNDTFSVYVDPTDGTVAANNTAYLNHTWTSTAFAETNSYGSINLRQGGSSSSAGLTVDDLIVSTTFGDVTLIPEPSTYAMLLGGLCALGLSFRSKRK